MPEINTRLWRVAFVTVPIAIAVAMFALESPPEVIKPPVPPDGFDTGLTIELARELADSAQEPRAGSKSDRVLGELVQARFAELDGVEVAEQRFSAGGKDLRNLIAVLPGNSERQVAVLAPRDVARGSGAATSIASTAALIELANVFSSATRRKTLVFVSTDGSSIGAAGAREFVSGYSDADRLDAIIALSDPASGEPGPPLVVPWGNTPESTDSQLQRTAADLVARETAIDAGSEEPLREFSRLALPSGFGEQSPLVGDGLSAVRITSAGERPSASSSEPDPDTLSGIGRGTLATLLALDAYVPELEHGPGAWVGVAGSLLPGWTFALFALALLLPVALVASSSLGAAASSPQEALAAVGRPLIRWGLPPLVSLAVFYALSLISLIPRPPFPFDPGAVSPGAGGWIGLALSILSGLAFARWQKTRRTGSGSAPPGDAAGALTLGVCSTLLLWPFNPYLSVCLALALVVWIFAASSARRSRISRIGVVCLGLLPLLGVIIDLSGRVGWGLDLGWTLLFMVGDGQIPVGYAVLSILTLSAGVAIAFLPVDSRPPEVEAAGIVENPYA